jgi:hypothetical protein|tara:strand:+ start:70 stop:219 length:150 start_codon:yes stop_codon:yes gene_type:complete
VVAVVLKILVEVEVLDVGKKDLHLYQQAQHIRLQLVLVVLLIIVVMNHS